jgi:aspartyl protease family protein
MARFALVMLLVSLLQAGVARAEIYRWTDADGTVHFTQDLNQVPPAQRKQARRTPAKASDDRLQTYTQPAHIGARNTPGASDAIRIPFTRRGSLMWVNAVVNDRHRVPFLIDTGASGVTLPADVVSELGIPIRSSTPRVTVVTANGRVRVPLVEIDSVQLGGARVEGLQATVNASINVGLLGGSFFNNYKYSVDAAASVITLTPNDGVRGGAAADEWRERFAVLQQSIQRLEAYLSDREVTRANRRSELEANLAALKEDLQRLEIEANHARVPQAWRH